MIIGNNNKKLKLVIDVGTQSTRALVFDSTGQQIAKTRLTNGPYNRALTGFHEWAAESFWQQLVSVCQLLWQSTDIKPGNISAMAITCQRGTMINLDKLGRPLRPAIIWMDNRIADQYPAVPWYWQLAFKVAGQTATLNYFRQKAPCNWIRQHQPDIWAATHKYLLLSGYLYYRLTGQYKESTGAVVGYLPFNYRKQHWASKSDWKWHVLPITTSQLPDLVATGSELGRLTPAAAEATGLPENLSVIAGASDKACEVLGCGVLDNTKASISLGTTATVHTVLQKYQEPMPFIPPFPAAIPGRFATEIMIHRGFWMVNWLVRHIGPDSLEQTNELQTDKAVNPVQKDSHTLDDLLQQVPAGSDGLLIQPYWSPGLKNLEARGAMVGFSDHHTRAHIYRAMIEGLGYALRDGLEHLEKKQNKPFQQVIISGGGSQSDAIMQIMADILGRPVSRPHTYETSGLGASVQIAVATGEYPDYQTAVSNMVSSRDSFSPDNQTSTTYQWTYQHLYQRLYNRLKPLYKQLLQRDSIRPD